ncbi:hypothetical protein GCM10009809_08460 [Isoptericola hypogeus]|uniref:Phage shock protein PspC N-terminal domain-containing protein n=1 Tax=Isoptericola hypogeus TaxID=300179 RepID=A0ABN2IZV6_9MICO
MSTDDLPQPPGPQPGPGPAAPGGDVPPSGGPTSPPRSGDGFFDSIRRMGLARSDDRWVGGVAGGVAERFGLDPLLVRGLLILSFFLTGAGIVVYAIAWALLPERRDGRIHLQQAIRGDFDVALLGAAVALVVGIAWGDGPGWWGFGIEWISVVIWVAVWVAIVWVVVKLIRDRRPRAGATPPGGQDWSGQGWSGGPSAPGGPTSWSPAADDARRAERYPVGQIPAERYSTEQFPAEPFTPAPPAPYLAAPAAPPATGATDATGGTAATGAYPGAASPGGRGSAPLPPAPPAPPVPAPRPPKPPRPVRRGPGAGAVGIVLGLVLLAGAVLVAADRVGDLGSPLFPTWLGISIVILGLGIVVTGLRGRRGGVLTFLAILAVLAGIVTWPFAGSRAGEWDFWDEVRGDGSGGAVISDGALTPHSLDEAEDGVHVRFGDATVDLTELDLSDVTVGDPVVVPVSISAGNATVLIPDGEAVEAEIEVIAGNAEWRVDGETRSVNTYTNGPARFDSQEVTAPGETRLLLDVDVRAGNLTIEESR